LIRHVVRRNSHVLNEQVLPPFLYDGMLFETEHMVSWITSCASASFKPALIEAW
jgi:hypothetical protein